CVDALDRGQQALEINPWDARAHHALTHVYEMTANPLAGLRWMRERRDFWADPHRRASGKRAPSRRQSRTAQSSLPHPPRSRPATATVHTSRGGLSKEAPALQRLRFDSRNFLPRYRFW